ncbi:DUF6443 domain-containing protein [Moheibacter lacus]|uniref:DUF2778 domain-containing protein n=1 Tax=Moheibacter lacus TaxID=2745851 RepID=A0A838ZTT5_9FLAO|nr:DUF6443 domain-containing protein [Moheibacter lacus]MBA5630381.1 DUF2778 domain-containing protein [Moheibacter lacus]
MNLFSQHTLKTSALAGFLFTSVVYAQTPTSTENYIYVVEPTVEVSAIDDQTPAIRTVQYFDGLGRPKQINQIKASPDGKDIITHIEYDGFGRQDKDFLPWPSGQQNGAVVNPTTLKNNTVNYYKQEYLCPPNNTQCNLNPYTQKKFENSPLNRVVQVGAPGNDWKIGSGNEMEFQYQANTVGDGVKQFKATTTWVEAQKIYNIALTQDGTYPANRLYKTITTDENGHSIHEFTNKEGQIVLKRTFVANGSVAGRDTDPGTELQIRADTYYVYDIYGNLTYVIPPMASVKSNVNTVLDELCYQYKYDSRNRLVEKKLPGKGWEWLVYDKQDRLVATKDAKQVAEGNNEWTFTKYDKFGRVAYTGLVGDAGTRIQVQNWVYNTFGSNNAEYDATGFMHDGLRVYYKADKGYPASGFQILTVNYYDFYAPSRSTDGANFPNMPGVDIRDGSNTANESLKGLLTSTVTRTLGTSNFEKSYMFYDVKSRQVYTHKINRLGGYTKIQNNLDFRGKPTSTITLHKYSSSTPNELKVQDNFSYDGQERFKHHSQSINNGVVQRIASNTYNEIGQLTYKLVGNNNSLPALQGVDYTYNIRGWLTGINNIADDLQLRGLPGEPLDDIFAFKIQYNDLVYGGEVATEPLYNGNISQTFWKTATDNITRGYSYEFDQMNRLRFAHFNKVTGTPPTGYYPGAFDESMAYDLNGNILHLVRHTEDFYGAESAMDDLKYTYKNDNRTSNQLSKVIDDENSSFGFTNGNSGTSNDYTYDANGNMISDLNKAIASITYNHLNLPKAITWTSGTTKKIEYLYDAFGVKVQKKVTSGSTVYTTDYMDGFQYYNGVLQFFPHPEGYVKQTTVNNQMTFDYVFNYTDHLGNVRLSYAKDPATDELKIMEENHYYPFGLRHKKYALSTPKDILSNETETDKALQDIDPTNPVLNIYANYDYKYNGKEYQDELGLGLYDYGWRNYDPALGRWMNIDPLAEKYASSNPYNYVLNNPINYVDPDGRYVKISYNAETGELSIEDMDNHKKGLQTVYVSAKGYNVNGIRDKKGNLIANQVLVIKGVFSGGISDSEGNINQGDENGTDHATRGEKQVPIPNGDYDILDNKGGKNSTWFRLDPQDSYRYDDTHQGVKGKDGDNRKNFRLHLGMESHGCVTICSADESSDRNLEWNVINQIMNTTSTSEVPDRQGLQRFNPTSTRTKYGTMEVIGTSVNPKKSPNAKPSNISPTVLGPVGSL